MGKANSRSLNSTRNIITGMGGQIINIVLGFIARTVFIKTLGAEYLGISGLFTTILSMLNISELGISTAIVFSLYRPLAQKDERTCQATLKLLKKLYRIIGLVVLGLGLALMPFLNSIVKGSQENINLYYIYLIYLVQSVLSYWFYSYKASILQADQKQYVISLAGYIITISVHSLQICVLLITKYTNAFSPYVGFLIYLSINMVFVLFKNLLVKRRVDKLYPYLSDKELRKGDYELEKEEKESIFKNVIGLSFYKISGTVLTSTDNIIISKYINIVTVGFYSNYILVLNMITTIVGIIFGAFTAGVGNLYATESKEKSQFIFKCLNFLNFWVYGLFGLCFYYLINPFIMLWLGDEYLFPTMVIVVIVINFLSDGLQNAVITYKDACGLFWEGKFRPLASALLNIVLSLILVKYIGITGVILGTILSRLLTTWWYDAYLVHNKAFESSPLNYYFRYIRSFVIIIFTGLVLYPIMKFIPVTGISTWILKGLACFVLVNIVFLLIFYRSEEFKYIYQIAKDLLKHFKKSLKPGS